MDLGLSRRNDAPSQGAAALRWCRLLVRELLRERFGGRPARIFFESLREVGQQGASGAPCTAALRRQRGDAQSVSRSFGTETRVLAKPVHGGIERLTVLLQAKELLDVLLRQAIGIAAVVPSVQAIAQPAIVRRRIAARGEPAP